MPQPSSSHYREMDHEPSTRPLIPNDQLYVDFWDSRVLSTMPRIFSLVLFMLHRNLVMHTCNSQASAAQLLLSEFVTIVITCSWN